MRVLSLLVILGVVSPALAQKEYGFDNRKPSGQPYLTPEETVKRLKVPPEFEVKLFAAEPMLTNPIAFSIDERGRVWAVESFEYPKKTPKGKMPRDRIVILEDTNGDGKADKRTVFAEGKDFPVSFDMASGLEVGNGGVYLGAPPYLFFIENKNDKPGKFEILLKGFGSQDTHETLNTFQWGPDGWLYGLHGIFTQSEVVTAGPNDPQAKATKLNGGVWRFHPQTKKFEVFAEGTSNPWGMDYRNTDGQFILACCVIPHLYHIVPGGIYRRQAGASNNPYAYGYIQEICDHTFHKESGWAHAGLISLDVPHMPERFRKSVIFGSIHGCSVKQNILRPNGGTYIASRGDDFLVSSDKNVRPLNMKWGPHGDIYLSDWHDQNPCHQALPDSWDYERGRIYRIQLKGRKAEKIEDLGRRSDVDLARIVAEEKDPYRYRQALRLLYDRNVDSAAVRDVVAKAKRTDDTVSQLRAGWIQQAARIHDPNFASKYPAVRAAAVRSLRGDAKEDWTGMPDPLFEQDATVRRELAILALRAAGNRDVTPLLHTLMWNPNDGKDPLIPHLLWLAYEKVLSTANAPAIEVELAWLLEECEPKPLRPDHIVVPSETITETILPRVMRRLVATGNATHLERCVAFVAKLSDVFGHPRQKALAGLVTALDGQVVDAPRGWAEYRSAIAKDATPETRQLLNKLAVSFRDPEAMKRAYAAVHDVKLSTADRIEALRQIVLMKHPDALSTVGSMMRQEIDLKVRAEAARQLAAFDNPRLGAETVRDWKMYPKEIRADVVNSLASRKPWARALLTALKQKKIDRAAVTDGAITRILAFKDAGLDKLIEEAWGKTRSTPAELLKQIDAVRESLDEGPASFAKGKVVFDNQCAKCHKFEGRGADVGPALDGAARDIEYLLGNVIDPNRVIGAPYFIRQVTTLDGQVIQGLLAEEDDRYISLKIEQGQIKKIAKKDLDGEVKVLEKSMMPEGLAAGMTPQDFRNLMRYVMADPFLTHVTVNGKAVAVGPRGYLPLPDYKSGDKVVVEAKLTAAAAVKTKLLIGSLDTIEVKIDGRAVGGAAGGSGPVEPDREALPVELTKGEHTVRFEIEARTGKGIYARFLDPERKLTYPVSK
ncbi:MAG TPA: PVC-type heme-binding CxxCH protein [Fimbriiglobus sp.]|jgi:putative membrane-bound dehydrogenase-like protein